ncbi:hypothetical protein Tco_0894406 [Tanacetum coccineum]|uniref:Uncharacterized protein n=1 Tax=Tanacetum coccineum TaxID=301880 RepID=A0ABQ5CCZ0_9ASTR
MAEAEMIDSEETEEEKVDSKQAGADQATKDDQAGAQISETQKEKPEVPPSSSSLSLSSNYEIPSVLSTQLLDVLVSVILPQTTSTLTLTTSLPTPPTTTEAQAIIISVPDPSPIVLERISELEKKVKALSKVDHSEAIEESVQANVINEVKNQLPKLLPKLVSNFVNPRIERTIRELLQKTPTVLAQSSFTPGQST